MKRTERHNVKVQTVDDAGCRRTPAHRRCARGGSGELALT
jgi:hypothetical protein